MPHSKSDKNSLLQAVEANIRQAGIQSAKAGKPEMAVSQTSYAGQMGEPGKGFGIA